MVGCKVGTTDFFFVGVAVGVAEGTIVVGDAVGINEELVVGVFDAVGELRRKSTKDWQ
jgi:hypothetical protein